jgi:hypothetical protein
LTHEPLVPVSGLLLGALACVIGALAVAGRNLMFAVALCVIALGCLGYAALEVLAFI